MKPMQSAMNPKKNDKFYEPVEGAWRALRVEGEATPVMMVIQTRPQPNEVGPASTSRAA